MESWHSLFYTSQYAFTISIKHIPLPPSFKHSTLQSALQFQHSILNLSSQDPVWYFLGVSSSVSEPLAYTSYSSSRLRYSKHFLLMLILIGREDKSCDYWISFKDNVVTKHHLISEAFLLSLSFPFFPLLPLLISLEFIQCWWVEVTSSSHLVMIGRTDCLLKLKGGG